MSSLGPILPGRIPSSLVTARLTRAMAANQQSLTKLQDQIGTGQRFFIPSEDPAAANRTILLQALRERKTQFLRNVETDVSLLSSTEGALGSVSDVLNTAKQLAIAGIGDSSSAEERQALAVEVQSLIRQVVNIGNATFRGRFLFGGSSAGSPPYEPQDNVAVRYSGDRQSLESLIDFSTTLATNINGHAALGGLSTTVSRDVNPALTLTTKIRDLHGGAGLTLAPIEISLSAGSQTSSVDLTGADTIADIKTRIENAFAPGDITVSINASQNGLQITAASGTVTVNSPSGSLVASDLGIAGGPAAAITGSDLNPALSKLTPLSALNGGTGMGPTAGNGLQIVNGSRTSTIDLTGVVTVEDLFNRIKQADPDVSTELSAERNGLEIASRLSGAVFSIGENNGQNATQLGIRTLVGGTLLSDLNHGIGVSVGGSETLDVTRRDGSVVNVDLSGALTVQDVVDAINAVDPGNLTASLASVGNGLSLVDNSGTGPLTIESNALAVSLGLGGTEAGANPAVPLNGTDPNPQEATGVFNLLLRLQTALETGDDVALTRLGSQIDAEIIRVTEIRGEVGGRLKTLDDARNRLEDEDLQIAQSLSENFDTDLATVLTQLVNQQTIFQAVLQTSAQMLQMGLINFI